MGCRLSWEVSGLGYARMKIIQVEILGLECLNICWFLDNIRVANAKVRLSGWDISAGFRVENVRVANVKVQLIRWEIYARITLFLSLYIDTFSQMYKEE